MDTSIQHLDFDERSTDLELLWRSTYGSLMCHKVRCSRRATWSALADTATDPHLPNVLTCDDHLVEIGLTSRSGDRDATQWTVWPINRGPLS